MRVLKHTLLFFSAAMIHGIGREFTQALTAGALGIPNTLYHYFVVYPDPNITARQLAAIYAAPIAFHAVLGLAALWMHARARSAAVSAFALYLAGGAAIGTIGAVAALGWEGRPQDIALVLGVPPAIRVSLAITGTLVLFVVLWQIGARLQPPGEALVLPFVFATTARVIAYAPLPFGMLLTMVVGSLYWVIAIGGAIWYRRTSGATTPPRRPLNLMLSAYTLPILLILIVRLMTTGIDFGM